jgi:hypothetical protein
LVKGDRILHAVDIPDLLNPMEDLLREAADWPLAGGESNFAGTGMEVAYIAVPSVKVADWLRRANALIIGGTQ